jgi:S1-C subfamily serine protease
LAGYPNTPAAAAGIVAGDVITEINGLPATSVGQAEFGVLTKSSDGTVIHQKVVRWFPEKRIGLQEVPPFSTKQLMGHRQSVERGNRL